MLLSTNTLTLRVFVGCIFILQTRKIAIVALSFGQLSRPSRFSTLNIPLKVIGSTFDVPHLFDYKTTRL